MPKTRNAVVSELERRGEVVIGPAQERRSLWDKLPQLLVSVAVVSGFAYIAYSAYMSHARQRTPVSIEPDVIPKQQARIKQLTEAARRRASDVNRSVRSDGAPSVN